MLLDYFLQHCFRIFQLPVVVLAIELFAASQGLDFSRLLKPGAGTVAAHDCVRSVVPYLKHDEYLHPLIERVEALLSRGAVVRAVEEAIGPLN